MIEKIKETLKQLEAAENECSKIDVESEKYPDDLEIEKRWNTAYKKEWELYEKASNLLAEFAEIDVKIARAMIRKGGCRENIVSILNIV